MSLVPPNLSASALQRFVQERLDYAEETDSGIALLKARQCRAALRQLSLVRPVASQQGGVGRGSGFSMEWDPNAIARLMADLDQWIVQRQGNPSKVFGVYHADMRDVQSPFPC